MEASTTLARNRFQKLLATRRGTLGIAAVCALLAAAVLVVFLSRYRESVAGEAAPTPVLVARTLIEKGTPSDSLAAKRQFEVVERKAEDVKQGAISDPALIAGKVAVADVYPGQQITASNFTAVTGSVLPKLSEDQRAIALPVDAAHGLVGQVQTGDHIDVLASYTATSSSTGQGQSVVKTLIQDALVLRAGAQPMEGAEEKKADESIVVRATDKQTVQLAHVADNGKVWIVLRPGGNAKQSKPQSATYNSIVAGTGNDPAQFKAKISDNKGNVVTVEGGPTK